MMIFTTRAKSLVLALSMIASTSISCMQFSNPFAETGTFLVTNKKAIAISTIVSILLAMKVRLDTKPKRGYTYDNWQDDVIGLLNSYNVFDAESRATIMAFVDKYCVGRKFKKEETMTRTKNDDGSVVTIKGNKVVQSPSGVVGLVDAYVLMQMEGLTKLVPAMAALYVLVNDPYGTFGRAFTAATK